MTLPAPFSARRCTACSRRTRSAPPSSPRSRRGGVAPGGRRASPSPRHGSARSTASPTPARSTSTPSSCGGSSSAASDTRRVPPERRATPARRSDRGPPARTAAEDRRRGPPVATPSMLQRDNAVPPYRRSAMGTPLATQDADTLAINTIRGLCMDAVQKANSGHPGTPMGIAPGCLHALAALPAVRPGRADLAQPGPFRAVRGPRVHPALVAPAPHRRPGGRSRLRGAGSGLPVTLDDLETFRQLDSHCPGHPEYRWTSGVEATTGPLGQGVADSVGMAIARDWLGRRYNRDDLTLFDFDVYALAGDGCMMEGISSEAASLAGHLGSVQPVLDLRLEPGHHRGAHRHRVHRGRRGALRRLRLERDHGGGRQRPGRRGPCAAHLQGRARATHPDPRAQPHRVRVAGRGLPEGPRRTLRRRRRSSRPSGSSACPRTRTSTCPTASTRPSPRGLGARGRAARRGLGATSSPATAPRTPSWPTRSS